MAVASPAAGHSAKGISGGDRARGKATSEVAGKEEPWPVDLVPGMGIEGKGAAPSEEGVPAATVVEREDEEDYEEEEEEKWVKHYSSMHSILTVGDGDFSFSLELASGFGSGAFMVATSLDTYEVLIRKYSNAKSNVMKLEILETTVLYGVDVKRMNFHADLANRRFDRIIFNFPHAGFKGPEDQVHMINLHKELLRGFFCNACHLLMPYGEIHVRHKTGGPYDKWDLEQLASESSLIMFEKERFQKSDYPGYNRKRGDGARCDQPFNLGSSCTFKFQIGNLKKQKKRTGNKTGSTPSLGGSNVHSPGNLGTDTRPFHPLPSCTFKFQIRNLKKQKKRTGNKIGSTPSLGDSNVHPPGNLGTDTRPFHPLPSCTFKFQIRNLKKQKKRTGNKTGSTPSLGGSNVHPPGNLGTDTRTFDPLPLPQAWSWLQFTPSVNTVSMPITLQPGLQLNLDGTVRDSAFHQQPMFSTPGYSAPSGIPPLISSIVFPNPISLLKQPWYQQRSINGMPGGEDCSYSELMPGAGAASSSYSFTFLQHFYREYVQWQEWLNRMIAYGCQ